MWVRPVRRPAIGWVLGVGAIDVVVELGRSFRDAVEVAGLGAWSLELEVTWLAAGGGPTFMTRITV